MDFYGGYKTSVDAFGFDVGAIYYYYPGTGAAGSIKIDNAELYVGGSWGPLTAKYFVRGDRLLRRAELERLVVLRPRLQL